MDLTIKKSIRKALLKLITTKYPDACEREIVLARARLEEAFFWVTHAESTCREAGVEIIEPADGEPSAYAVGVINDLKETVDDLGGFKGSLYALFDDIDVNRQALRDFLLQFNLEASGEDSKQ